MTFNMDSIEIILCNILGLSVPNFKLLFVEVSLFKECSRPVLVKLWSHFLGFLEAEASSGPGHEEAWGGYDSVEHA